MDSTQAPSRFGRARFGGRPRTLLLAALGAGLLVAATLAGLVVWASSPPPGWVWTVAFVTFASTLPAGVVAGWSALVDYRSLPARTRREESVESNWSQRAAAGAFGDLLVLAALATAPLAFLGLPVSPSLAVGCVPLVGLVCFGVRYLLLNRKER